LRSDHEPSVAPERTAGVPSSTPFTGPVDGCPIAIDALLKFDFGTEFVARSGSIRRRDCPIVELVVLHTRGFRLAAGYEREDARIRIRGSRRLCGGLLDAGLHERCHRRVRVRANEVDQIDVMHAVDEIST
jgi:hypothetical protein